MESRNYRSLIRDMAAADNGDASGAAAASAANFDDDYRPPSEAEQKVLKARRERSDKIAKRMGEYLLKGWKMLDQVCPDCGTILLEVSGSGGSGGTYCIACRELESDVSKDDPAQSEAAARAHVKEATTAAAAAAAATATAVAPAAQSKPRSSSSDFTAVRLGLRTATLDRLDFYRQRLLSSTECGDTEALLATLDRLLCFLERLD